MVALVFMILFIVVALGLLSYGIYKSVMLVKSPTPRATNYPLQAKKLGLLSIASGVATLLVFILLCNYQGYHLNAGEWVELIIGSLLFGHCLPAAIYSFIIHYYGKEVPEKLNKWLFRILIIGLLVAGLGLLLLTNGLADSVSYPLVNGISFKEGFTTPLGPKPSIAWYAICILGGAILVYFVCDHRFYVEYGKHGILESTFLVAFPAGVIGARIGYVIGNWSRTAEGAISFAQRVANGQWWAPLAIWEGGLTIISGALVGIIVGVLWFIWRNKKYSIWLAVDIIVPTILIAQAVGRWGNFFNAEVHGNQVLAANWSWFLPKMVLNNATYSEKLGQAASGYIFAPLFYIEFLSNLAGYFFIRFALGKGLRKYLNLGDLAFSYIVWYGLTRAIMEPLRNINYNMGTDNYYSWIWAMVFVVAGCFAIFINHLVRYLINKNKIAFKEQNVMISSFTAGGLLAVSVAFIALGAVYMGGIRTHTMGFDEYNIGLLLLILGLGVLSIFGCSIIYLIQGLKRKNETV